MIGLLILLVSLSLIGGGVWEVRQPDVLHEEDVFGDERYWTVLFRHYGYLLIVLGVFGVVVATLILTRG